VTVLAAALGTGVTIGLSIAAPIGASSILCIQQTLSRGLPTGVATGFGVATVHLIYSTLAAASGTLLLGALFSTTPILLVSGMLLLAFAVRIYRREVVVGEMAEGQRKLLSSYCGAIGFGFLNPVTPVLFAAAVPSIINQGHEAIPLTVGGIFMGSACWWAVLAVTVSLLRQRVTGRRLGHINKCAALFMGYVAAGMVLAALRAAG
jgi:threonine/homoserine/homoserine lactone efflux protein